MVRNTRAAQAARNNAERRPPPLQQGVADNMSAAGSVARNPPPPPRRERIRERQDPAGDGNIHDVVVEDLDDEGNTLPPPGNSHNSGHHAPSYDVAIRDYLAEHGDDLRRYLALRQVDPSRQQPGGGREPSHLQPRSSHVRGGDGPHHEEPPLRQNGGDRRAPDQHQRPPHVHHRRPRTPPREEHNDDGFGKYELFDTPFSQAILRTPLPRGYKTPSIQPYDGLRDPRDFLNQYKYAMFNQGMNDAHMCRILPELLVGNARQWFDTLPRGSIGRYKDLLDALYRRFFQKTTTKVTSAHLFTIRQAHDESITDYMTRFNRESLLVDQATDLILITAFQNGIRPGELYKEIVMAEPQTVAELWNIADRFAKADEANRKKREAERAEPKKKDDQRHPAPRSALDRLQRPPIQSRLGPQRGPLESRLGPRQGPEPPPLTPLTKPRAEIFELHTNLFGEPRPLKRERSKRQQPDQFCAFHKDFGHITEDCRDLAANVEGLVQSGALKKYAVQQRKPNQKRGKRKQARGRNTCAPPNEKKPRPNEDEGDDEEPQPTGQFDGEIGMITGLPHGTTRSAHRADTRRAPQDEPTHKRFKKEEGISFTDADPVPEVMPHNDAIVIRVVIANKLVHRALIDTGASISVLFKGCFDQLAIGDAKLAPAPIPLRSFAQDETHPLGVVSIPLTVGQHPRTSTQAVQFFVIDVASPYNLILGRDWLNAVRAICSTHHLTIKLPTPNGVATVRGDQKKAKECLQIALRRVDTSTQCLQA